MIHIQGFLDGLKPEERLSVWAWADKYRYLSPVASAEPGQWRTDRVPYMREIMEKLSIHDPTQEIIMMKGAQIAFTETAFNFVGYVIDIAPGPMLVVQPTEETVKRASKQRFDPMVEATPRLYEKVAGKRSRDSSNTTFQKDFPGGTLVLTGANSAAGLRSMPMRYLFLDEIDAYPEDLEGEGSPIDLAEARTRTFRRKKILKGSTPTVESHSAIEKEFLKTDQRYYHVPCPDCGHYQKLIWGAKEDYGLKWEPGKPETARYVCCNCGVFIEERHKPRMLAAGEWRADCPENISPHRAGYHLSSLYSPFGWYSWAEAAADWEDAQGDINKLKTFVNTVLGEVWVDKGEAPPWENLYNRREQYALNKPAADVCLITAGVDVQKDRLEVEIVGWCKQKRSYSIDYRVLPGDTATPAPWDELAKIVDEQWERADGLMLPLRLMAVDTGYHTSEAYAFCRRFDQTRVVPVKGNEKQGVPIYARSVEVRRDGARLGTINLWNVDAGYYKSELYGWLRQEIDHENGGAVPFGYCHFPEYPPEYFRGLTAEQLETKIVRGYKKKQWVKKYERNEPLDCRVYARAAAGIEGIDRWTDEDFDALVEGYARAQQAPGAGAGKKKKSRTGFWD